MRKSLHKFAAAFAAALAMIVGACAMLVCENARPARAADGDFSAEMLFGTDSATTITPSGDYAGLTVDANGADVSGQINGVFTENTALEFQFPSTAPADGSYTGKQVVFTVYDLLGEEVFSVHFESGDGWMTSGAYLMYGEEYRASGLNAEASGWGGGIFYQSRNLWTGSGNALPSFNVAENTKIGSLSFEWEGENNDILSVYHTAFWSAGSNYGFATEYKMKLASFDGTDTTFEIPASGVASFGSNANAAEAINTTGQFALPKIADRLKDGYTIGFTSAGDIDINFVSINGEAMATIASEPAFYSAWADRAVITLSGSFPTVFAKGYTTAIPSATYTTVAEPTPAPVEKVELTDPDGVKTDITSSLSVTPAKLGTYTVSYIAQVGSEADGNVQERTFEVKAGVDTESLVTTENELSVESGDYDGLHITGTEGFSGSVNGVFKGNTEIYFRAPSSLPLDGSTNGLEVVFTVADLNGEDVFEIHFPSNGWGTMAYVKYGEEIRAGVTNSIGSSGEPELWTARIFFGSRPNDDSHGIFAPYFASGSEEENKRAGLLSLEWSGDVLNVYALNHTAESRVRLASFDGTLGTYAIPETGNAAYESLAEMNANGQYALPKVADRLQDGYTVKVSGASGSTLDLVSVNGVSLANEFVPVDWSAEITHAEEQSGTIYVPQGDEIAPAQIVYTAAIGGSWSLVEKENVAFGVDTSATGSQQVTIKGTALEEEYQTVSKEYTVVVETAYTLTFEVNGGNAIAAITWSDHTRGRLGSALPEAVKDYWTFDGWYLDENFETPAALEDITGTATIYAKWLDEGDPAIELDGIEDAITVQLGDAISVGEDDVRASDAAQGNDIELTIEVKFGNGAFEPYTENYSFGQVGTYTVRYTAADPAGNSAFVERTITVIDEVAPVIELGGTVPETGFAGHAITLPSATATDNGASVDVVLTVTFNNEPVSVENNVFTPALAGNYEVVYTATDENDNSASVTKTIVVSNDETAPVISVDGENMSVLAGAEITVPGATATDNCDGTVSVEYKVYFGTQEVSVTDGKFTAENAGEYRIEYTATDVAGNVGTATVTVTVTEQAGGCQSCSGNVAAGTAGLCVLAAALALVVLIRRKNRKA